MRLETKFIDSCLAVAEMIENNELATGKHIVADNEGNPYCSLGWIAAASGVSPNEAYSLFEYFDVKYGRLTHFNDGRHKEYLVEELRDIARQLKESET